MATTKSKKFQQNRIKGKSHNWTIDIIVPKGQGFNRCCDGKNRFDDNVNETMIELFSHIETVLTPIRGIAKVYQGGVK